MKISPYTIDKVEMGGQTIVTLFCEYDRKKSKCYHVTIQFRNKEKKISQTLFFETTGSSTPQLTIIQGFSRICNCILFTIVKQI